MRSVFLKYAVAVLAVCVVCGCSKDNPTPDVPVIEQSNVPISFSIQNNDLPSTRAHIFTPSNFTDHNTGGGNFSVFAFLSGTSTEYIDDARVWYFADFNEWDFSKYPTEDKAVDLYNCYWPFDNELDFFAYMPMKTMLDRTPVSNLSFSPENGPSFDCTLPLTKPKQDNLTEFMYAYTPNQAPNPVNPDNSAVSLNFQHPFAVVYLKLKRGVRMELKNISFVNIKYAGSYTHQTKWVTTTTGTLSLDINKRIPQDINYETVFAGPFLVLPQDLEGITMSITGDTENTTTDLNETGIVIKTSEVSNWEAGKAYTYSLDLGDNKEEVLFEVVVEAWDKVNHKHIIGVE